MLIALRVQPPENKKLNQNLNEPQYHRKPEGQNLKRFMSRRIYQ